MGSSDDTEIVFHNLYVSQQKVAELHSIFFRYS